MTDRTAAPLPPAPSAATAGDESRLREWFERHLTGLKWLGGLVFAGLVFVAMKGVADEINYHDVMRAIHSTTRTSMAWSALAGLVSYLALTGYDRSALRHVGVELSYRVIAPTSFIAFALTNTVGLSVLTGGAVRMRLYGAAGVETGQISRAIAFNAVAFTVGLLTVGAVALLWSADKVAGLAHTTTGTLHAVAWAILLAMGGLLVACAQGRELSLGGARRLRLPKLGVALQQLLWSTIDITAAAVALWCLLPAGAVSLPVFVSFYAIATLLGVLSHVPGGLGVFEAVMLGALGGHVPTEALAGALVLYRLIYYVLPLVLALLLLLRYEFGVSSTPAMRVAGSLTPLVLAVFTCVVGVLLMVSGVTPTTAKVAHKLATHVPLSIVEASHFLGSIAGLGLLTLARGLWLRLDAAWWASVVLVAASLVFALPKGIALNEALVLGFLLAMLLATRRRFDRKAVLLAQTFSWSWLQSIAMVLLSLAGLLVFAYRDVGYTDELWWQFEFDAHASRSLRVFVGLALLLMVLALRQLFWPRAITPGKPTQEELARARAVIERQDIADAGLALMGDKSLLFSDSGQSFLMFAARGRSWISLFDPIGREEEHQELVWRLLERAREAGGRASFYQVRPNGLPIYVDAGLRLFKLGEDGHVPLQNFSLKGRSRSNLRSGFNRAEREGLTFEVVTVEGVPGVLEQLRAVSDAWLGEHDTAEKSFSLGAFADDYILCQPVAVVRKGESIVAFATMLQTAMKVEASVDLMRHLPDAPKGAMDFLFVHLLLHFQAQGFQRFGLGMAPLSGMADHPLASSWHRFGRLLFAHGEHFYNFQGLRAFKEKFDPVWESRYLAAPGGVAPLLVLADIAALISGGFAKVVGK